MVSSRRLYCSFYGCGIDATMLNIQRLGLSINGQTLLDDVSFTVEPGETLCIVGESGSGKTSLLKSIQGLMPAYFEGISFQGDRQAEIRQKGQWRGPIGMPGSRWVMQDPIAALNPKIPLGQSISESLYRRSMPKMDVDAAVRQALLDVELNPDVATRLPSEVSMGQAQRACLARALIANPSLILFDEPLSALDAVVQKQIAATMKRIQLKYEIMYLIVTHDLGFASAYADQVMVLKNGKVEANQTAADFFHDPASPYCRDLVLAARALGSLSGPAIPSSYERGADV
ncbi:dipeptide transport ATP-binding protein DppD [Roseibium sp. TrichSKD4]|nr:dipeptide transport ATP-binding protein DppD [Roseibium sp. TrichSKD4]